MDKLRAIANIIAGRPVIYNVTFVDNLAVDNWNTLYSARVKMISSSSEEKFDLTLGRNPVKFTSKDSEEAWSKEAWGIMNRVAANTKRAA